MSQIILYDLANKQNSGWSYNPWKTRMALNFKGVEYKTEWTEYPDLVPKLKSLGIPPHDPNSEQYSADYTSPAIKFEDGKNLMDSWVIAAEIEKRYPLPSLHLDEPVVIQVRDTLKDYLQPIRPEIMSYVPRDILNPYSAEYFERTRKEKWGYSLSELEKKKGGEQAWEAARQPIKNVADLLKKNSDGPFFLGKTASYADIIFVSFLQFLKRVRPSVFERFLQHDPAFSAVYEASKQWLEKDD